MFNVVLEHGKEQWISERTATHTYCNRQNNPFCKQDVRLSETNGKYLTLDCDHTRCSVVPPEL
jgi:hypothetical protein